MTKNLQDIRDLLMPSFASGSIILTIGLISYAVITFMTSKTSGMLYEWLFGNSSSASQIQTAESTLSVINDTVLGNELLNKLLFLVLWALIGIAAYVVFVGVNRQVKSAGEALEDIGGRNSRASEVRMTILRNLLLRLIFLACWGIFIIFSVKIYFPFALLCARIGGSTLDQLSGWLFSLAGFVTFVLSLHLHLVFARLVALRTRLF